MTAIRATLPYQLYRIFGDDALTFLQGQLTQDVSLIQPNDCHYAAYCNPKGKMLANFILSRDDKGYLLCLHQRQADTVMKRLQLFVLRAQVTIEAVDCAIVALNRAAAESLCAIATREFPDTFHSVFASQWQLCRLPNDFFLLIAFADSEMVSQWLCDTCEDVEGVENLRLHGGHFQIMPETHEKILPQQTTVGDWGGIKYEKGCYVGQEIIARNKYLGKLSKGMGYAELPQAVALTLPATVEQNGRAVGQVIDYYHSENKTFCLALLNLKALGVSICVAEQPTIFTPIANPME